jgi:hypothetical protein
MNLDSLSPLYDFDENDLKSCDGPLYKLVQAAGYTENPYNLINKWNCWNVSMKKFVNELKKECERNSH